MDCSPVSNSEGPGLCASDAIRATFLEFVRSKDTSKMIVDTSGIEAHYDADKE